MHHVRRIDDSDFINGLYNTQPAPRAVADTKDSEFQKEQAKKKEEVIAKVKACGHPMGDACGC